MARLAGGGGGRWDGWWGVRPVGLFIPISRSQLWCAAVRTLCSRHCYFNVLFVAALARGRNRTVDPRKLKQPASKCVGVDGNIRNKIIKIKSVDFFSLGGRGGANCQM